MSSSDTAAIVGSIIAALLLALSFYYGLRRLRLRRRLDEIEPVATQLAQAAGFTESDIKQVFDTADRILEEVGSESGCPCGENRLPE